MWLSTHLPSPFVPADLYHLIFYKLPPSSLLSSIHLGSHVIHSDSVLASLYFLWWRLFFLITLFSVQHSTCSRADVLQSSVKSMNEWRMKPTQVLLIHLSRSSTKHFYLLFQGRCFFFKSPCLVSNTVPAVEQMLYKVLLNPWMTEEWSQLKFFLSIFLGPAQNTSTSSFKKKELSFQHSLISFCW